MQLALSIIFFFLGFGLATLVALRPHKARKDIEAFTSQLRHVTNGMKGLGPHPGDLEQSETNEQIIKRGSENLLTKEQLEEKYDMNAWQRLVYEEFKTTILAKGTGLKTFPCVYATMGYRAGDHRYIFLESDDPSEPRNVRIIAPALRAYLQVSRSLGPNTSLVIMGAPTEASSKTVEEYNNEFFDMLRGLRIWDSKPWPKDIPQETMNEKWTFCFDGIPLFPVALTPAHQRRWSRHAPVPLVALQPKWVLDNLMSTPEKRKSATGKVRKLLAEYDQIEISPDLTQYGEVGTSEIHQLCLRDENETMDCPFDDFDKGGVRSSSSSRRSSLEERAA
ncbi:hypothetical protein AUEXF2481DRAFT_628147 [Aureobasidium subglaciale EXF-2481]|uniref:YqcI/YcgG family protein n=1 Tax=Aureobasidium subglaciale (strain EXF-2481) TaxID=1043005 RepID=A0A074YGW5_AURSE|nr:uncharacterized protein AUEXF2481DRAFT_628147 [Aureobasidium subglaciale EXF-2481]KEQ97053.1 hypothetical protein AUEXF2481DRAFT_628147 [Aureobasidium subglaciale EXF-2481]